MDKLLKIIKCIIRAALYSRITSSLFRIFKTKNCYACPICNYYGWFKTVKPETGERKNAKCSKCGSLERHRLQYLVFKKIVEGIDTKKLKMLHFSPEEFFRNIFKNMFGEYITADLSAENVDRKEDLTKLSFSDSSFDFIFTSHVLEHIKNDLAALSEIRRVLKPKGIAIIPVPIIGEKTIEYFEQNPHENDHVRCPGKDYYERYKEYFAEVKIYKSSDFDEEFQLYIYEDRTTWPNTMPLRPSVFGVRHLDMVPVCYK